MAIKSKKKSRSKGKQVARAPRREPVAVPTPFFARRWVQVVAGVLVGMFAVMVFVWLMNGLRSNDADSQAADEAASKRKAALAYQGAVEDAFGTVGTLTPGLAPSVFPEMLAALQKMQKGTTPDGAADTFEAAATGAKDATAAIVRFGVAKQIRDQGFNATQATVFTSSAQQLSLALQQFQRCAEAGGKAVAAEGDQREELLTLARGSCDGAQAELSQAWGDFQAALQSGGVVDAPTSVPGLPGLTGPTGSG